MPPCVEQGNVRVAVQIQDLMYPNGFQVERALLCHHMNSKGCILDHQQLDYMCSFRKMCWWKSQKKCTILSSESQNLSNITQYCAQYKNKEILDSVSCDCGAWVSVTSHDDIIICVTGPLCGEFTSHLWIPPHKGQWCGALMFSLICTWTNCWVNYCKAGNWDAVVLIMTSQ